MSLEDRITEREGEPSIIEDENICSCGGILEYDDDRSTISDICSHDNDIVMTCPNCHESYSC